MRYAQAKGYSRAYAALALLNVFGLIALILVPTQAEPTADTTVCDNPDSAPPDSSEVTPIASSPLRTVFTFGLIFLLGWALVVVPFFVHASMVHADETARGEQTMQPGIEMFIGLIMAAIAGVVCCIIFALFRRRNMQCLIFNETAPLIGENKSA